MKYESCSGILGVKVQPLILKRIMYMYSFLFCRSLVLRLQNAKLINIFLLFRLTLNANEDYSSSNSDEEFISRLDLSFESDNESVDSIPSDTKCVTELSKLQI